MFKKIDPSIVLQIVVGLLVSVCAWGFNAKLDNNKTETFAHSDANIAALKQSITEGFETKTDHAADIATIKQWCQNLSDTEKTAAQEAAAAGTATSVAIQHLSDQIDNKK